MNLKTQSTPSKDALSVLGEELISQKTKWTPFIQPKIPTKTKIKMNNGIDLFQKSKKIVPMKFQYKAYEADKPVNPNAETIFNDQAAAALNDGPANIPF